MQRTPLLALLLAFAASLATASTPCTESGGVAIDLSGNHGFCYLVGQRMRKDSIYAQCKDGVLTCFADEGIPDKPKQIVACVAPTPGMCGSSATAPTNTSAAPASDASSVVGHVRSASW